MRPEELASDGEDAVLFHPSHFRPAPRVLAHLHPEWPNDFVEICAVEEGVR